MNHFDDPDGNFQVLANAQEQFCLWPAALDSPGGWRVALEASSRSDCDAFLAGTWRDIRPANARGQALDGTGTPLIHQLVSDQVKRTPNRVAVSFSGDQLTYLQLDADAELLAERLRAVGVGGGSVVAVMMHRSLSLIVSLLGVLKAGGAYLYVDPDELATSGAKILGDSAATVGVTTRETAAPGFNLEHLVYLGGPIDELGVSLPVNEMSVTPDTPMYVCYTSGSTGEPKGVVVPHRAVVRLIDNPWWIDLQDDDVFLQLTRVGFDVSTFEIWMPLVHGLRLALAPTGHADLSELTSTVRAEGVTVLWLTSGLFHKVVDHHVAALEGVRHLLAGGDVLSPAHVDRVFEAHPGIVFTNGYGPTENTTFTTCWTSRDACIGTRVPIGRAVDGTSTHVLDDDLRPVPPGSVGELWVGGAGVATGYLNKPIATAERFVADVDPARPGERMYRTGDLVVSSSEGALEFLGRADRQIKIRGYRVEPSTVENELLGHPKVEQAAVTAHTDGAGDARLIAYVAIGSDLLTGGAAIAAELRDYLHKRLAAHLVPWAIFPVAEIPLSPNGKIDRSALPVARMPRNVWNDFVEPRTDLQAELATIWSDALLVEPIGITDDFFELGGHSLLAAELLAALQDRFRVEMSAKTLFLNPTVEALAEEVRRMMAYVEVESSGAPAT
jgi:amino acid adenylation domain-containing protein